MKTGGQRLWGLFRWWRWYRHERRRSEEAEVGPQQPGHKRVCVIDARPVAGDEPGEPVRYAVQLHVLMSEAEMGLWERVADRWRLEIDDAVHAAALGGLKDQLAHDGDEGGAHVAEACAREVRARRGPRSV